MYNGQNQDIIYRNVSSWQCDLSWAPACSGYFSIGLSTQPILEAFLSFVFPPHCDPMDIFNVTVDSLAAHAGIIDNGHGDQPPDSLRSRMLKAQVSDPLFFYNGLL
jgi:hypothetical protein